MTSASAGWLTEMGAGAAPPDIAAAVTGGAGMIVPDFPIDSQRMLEFLRGLGHPLTEYVRLIPGEPRGDSTGVNVVKLRADGTGSSWADELWSATPQPDGTTDVRLATPGDVAELLVWDVTGALDLLVRALSETP